eukprot:gene7240-8687_t
MPVLATLALGVSIVLGAGGVLFYNLHIANCYKSSYQKLADRADYERKYKQLAGLAQPRITDVQLGVSIEPDKRRLQVKGRYMLENKSGQPITDIYITQDTTADMQLAGLAQPRITDVQLGVSI